MIIPALHIEDVAAPEREKYHAIWNSEEFRAAPRSGLVAVDWFMKLLKPEFGSTIIDLGCGNGAAGLEFERKSLWVSYTDLVDILDPAVPHRHFTECPLWSTEWQAMRPHGWDYGFCADVLEHLPTEYTMLAIDRVVQSCRTSWLQIAFLPDTHGHLIDKPLHLTVQPFGWWRDRIASITHIIDCRDLCGRGVFVVKRHVV